jgi:aminoglycoside 6'-N-acetyltransferase
MTNAVLFQPGEWIQLAIAEPATDRLLGDIGLHLARDVSVAEVGFTLARQAQGRGIATAAAEAAVALILEHTAASRVVGITDARNLPSVRLLARLGMRQVESRQTVFKGEACTELVFSIER